MTLFFSIITPCFKGKAFLQRAYNSILGQSSGYNNLEWIIVDDFSNDNNQTRDVIMDIQRSAPFLVKSIFLEKNYHGSRSPYLGAQNAKGNYGIILDQDDMLTNDAIDILLAQIEKYHELDTFAGVCGRCSNLKGELIGTPFDWEEKLSDEFSIRHVDKIRGELFQCTKIEYLLEYFKGMKKGYTNGWAWSRMSMSHQFLYINKAIRIYDTANPTSVSHTRGVFYVETQFEQLTLYLKSSADYFKNKKVDPFFYFSLLTQWCRLGAHINKSSCELRETLPREYHYLFIPSYFMGFLRSKKDGSNFLLSKC